MGKVSQTLVALAFGASALGFTAASADHRDRRDDDARITLSLSVGDNYDDHSYGGRYDDDRYRGRDRDHRYRDRDRDHRYDGRRDGSRVVKRRTYDTRYRARIVLIEEVYFSRRGSQRVCTIDVRGPEARYVSRRQLRNVAHECSPRARIRYS